MMEITPNPQRSQHVPRRLLLVGNPLEFHVGGHFVGAAASLGWPCAIADLRQAWSGNKWINRVHHHLLGKHPPKLKGFGHSVLAQCESFRPELLLSTGVAPLSGSTLRQVRAMGIRTANFLTDDPWNSANGAGFFWKSLKEYDIVFSPRRANMEDLRNHGCGRVEYLPFGYNPKIHFIETDPTPEEIARFTCDVAILGGADGDRLPLARALSKAGFNLALYGGYWDRDKELKKHWRGFVHDRDLRLAVRLAGCQVCMGRRANRDGHAMRSLEFPAMGACLVAEDTPEHRELYGGEGETVLYWQGLSSLISTVTQLVSDLRLRKHLAAALHQKITQTSKNQYRDRLLQISQIFACQNSDTALQ